MSSPSPEKTTTSRSGQSAAVATRDASNSPLITEHGNTTIADGVVAKIAGIAAREISGVHALGGGAARTFGALRERIPGQSTNVSQGVTVEVGDEQAAVDVSIIAEYGIAIADLAAGIRRNVINSVERMTGMEVTEVNIAVLDIHLPSEDSGNDDDDQ